MVMSTITVTVTVKPTVKPVTVKPGTHKGEVLLWQGDLLLADWPILNALVNTSCGASWVSVHHGGGVGIGLSIHAGMVCVADGTELADERLQRVLTADPATGIIRHAGAGYEKARQIAKEREVKIPI